MARTSKIRRLPPELREQLHSMLDAGVPLEDITAQLRGLGADVSRSGLGRYKQQIDKVSARMRESRQMAEAIMDRMGADAATGKGGAALIQMLTTLTTDYMVRRIDNPDTEMEVDDLRALSRAIKERAQAARATQDYDIRLREDARAEAEAKVLKAVDAVTAEPGSGLLTPEQMRERLLAAYRGD